MYSNFWNTGKVLKLNYFVRALLKLIFLTNLFIIFYGMFFAWHYIMTTKKIIN
jgi:hypothetical protein